jgi:hypothetical protein
MRDQDFDRVRADLLPEVERLVVAEHAALHRDLEGEAWSPPHAYRWIGYESPDPVTRLRDATRLLGDAWARAAANPNWAEVRAQFTADAELRLRRAIAIARALGYTDDAANE